MSTDGFGVTTSSAGATRAIGGAIAQLIAAGDVVLLLGELGSGKTTLVAGLAEALSSPDPATSPSFALCHLYATEPPLAHVDCWRMAAVSELTDLALEEHLEEGGAAVFEWGELARERFGADALVVAFSGADQGADPDERHLHLSATGPRWSSRLGRLAEMVDRRSATSR